MNKTKRRALPAIAAAAALMAMTHMAHATDTIRVMKVVPQAFQLTVVDVGVEKGIFAKYDLELEISGAGSGAKLHQALAADGADIGLGTGPGMGFVAKGAPEIAIAATHGAPYNLGVVVSKTSPLYPAEMTVDDLKGRKIGVASPSSLTYFLVRSISVAKGWGPDGITAVPLGRVPAQMAAMKTGNTDGFMNSTDIGYGLELRGAGRTLVSAGDYLPNFHAHMIFATNKFREANPDAVRRFLAAYFETVALIKADKQAMVSTGVRVLEVPEAVLSKAYDEQIKMVRDDGHFDALALEAIAEGLVATGIADAKPDMTTLYTEEYLPAK